MSDRFVVLGNGVAGIEAALLLRRRAPEASIAVVSHEHDHFFSRPALMYVFAGQLSLPDTEPRGRSLYESMRFDRMRGEVVSLDARAKSLAFAGGSTLTYDRLLIASGSRARPAPWPGAAGPGVHQFVTLRDLEALDAEARPGQKAAVVGGGLIGVEVAEILRHRGLAVTFVIREPWYFPAALDAQEAALVAEHMKAHGCDVRMGTTAQAVLRDDGGRLTGLRTDAGDVACDLVVSCIGVVPNTAFLAGSGLAFSPGGAVEVDDSLRTNRPDVWAAGDCANVTWIDGSRRPEQLWYTARDQGRVAARSMLGDAVTYRRTTWYNSAKFFDVEYTTAGWIPTATDGDGRPLSPDPALRTWFQRLPDRPESQRIVVKEDRVIGFSMLGSRWNHERLLEWIDAKKGLDWTLAHLHEAQFDEELSPRFRVLPGAALS